MFVVMTANIAHTLHPHRQLLVAFSGGLDSTVLLHQLVLLREQDPSLTLRAVHVHHGLSAHADDWWRIVGKFASSGRCRWRCIA